MALTTDEKQIIKELKEQGRSLGEIRGFLASNRVQKPSRVSEALISQENQKSADPGVLGDIQKGFSNAVESLDKGVEDFGEVSKRKNFLSRSFGQFVEGAQTAGQILTNVGEGAVRALPGGTTAMDTVQDTVGGAVKAVAESDVGQATGELVSQGFSQLPQGVQDTIGDVGKLAEGATSIAGAITVPGASNFAAKGISEATKTVAKTGFQNIDNAAQEFAKAGIGKTGTGGIFEALEKGLDPENIMQRVARVSKDKQSNFKELSKGESIGSYLVTRDIFGSPDKIVDQLVERMDRYKKLVDRNLQKIEGNYRAPQIKTALDELSKIDKKVSTPGAVGKDSNRIAELLKKHGNEGLTLSEVNEVKRLFERNVRVNYININNPNPANLTRANNIDSALRQFVEDKASLGGFNNVKQLNKETQLAKQLADDLGAEYAGIAGNNSVSLTDWIMLAEAAGNPVAAGTLIAKKTFGSSSVMSATAKALASNRGVNANIKPDVTPAKVNQYLEFLKRNQQSN